MGDSLSLEKSIFVHGFTAPVCHEVTLGASHTEEDVKWQSAATPESSTGLTLGSLFIGL